MHPAFGLPPRRIAPFARILLKQRVDERRDGRAVRKNNQATKQGENHKDSGTSQNFFRSFRYDQKSNRNSMTIPLRIRHERLSS